MTPPTWFKGCLTAWGIHVARFRWNLIECQRIVKGQGGL